MAAKKKRGVPYQRTGKWVGGINFAGKRYWVGTFDTKSEWEDAAAQLRVQLRAAGPSPGLTVGEFATRKEGWPDTHPKKRRTKLTSIENLRERIKPVVRDFGDRYLRGGITRSEAREWADTVSVAALGAARQMFNDAFDDGLTDANPFAGLGIGTPEGRRNIDVITPPEFDRLVGIARVVRTDAYGEMIAALLEWQGTVGTRPGEAFALPWSNLDPVGMRAFISRRIDKKGRFDLPKNGKKRWVRVPPRTMSRVMSMPRLSDELVWPNLSGDPMRPPAWFWYWNPIRAAFLATLPKDHYLMAHAPGNKERRLFSLYELRHRAATWMSELPPNGLGLDPAAVAAQLGHTDGGQLVTQLYRHMDTELALDRVSDAFSAAARQQSPLPKGNPENPELEGEDPEQAGEGR